MPIPPSARAVVTGAGSGLGRAFCLELARRGAKLVCADIDEAAARRTADEVRGTAVRCDVARIEEVEALAAAADRALGGVDVVVNNAGVAVAGNVGDIPLDDWRWLVGVNFWGVVHGCHVFTPRLRKAGRGHIVNVASIAGVASPPNMAPYASTKAAVIALSESLAAELKSSGVGVTVLCPYFFQTNIGKNARGGNAKQAAMIEKLMSRSKVQADGVARYALDAADKNELYAMPHTEARWMWRLKRWAPDQFASLSAKLLARMERGPSRPA